MHETSSSADETDGHMNSTSKWNVMEVAWYCDTKYFSFSSSTGCYRSILTLYLEQTGTVLLKKCSLPCFSRLSIPNSTHVQVSGQRGLPISCLFRIQINSLCSRPHQSSNRLALGIQLQKNKNKIQIKKGTLS